MDLETAIAARDEAIEKLRIATASTSYSIGERSISHQPLPELRAQVTYWTRIVDSMMGRTGTAQAQWN